MGFDSAALLSQIRGERGPLGVGVPTRERDRPLQQREALGRRGARTQRLRGGEIQIGGEGGLTRARRDRLEGVEARHAGDALRVVDAPDVDLGTVRE